LLISGFLCPIDFGKFSVHCPMSVTNHRSKTNDTGHYLLDNHLNFACSPWPLSFLSGAYAHLSPGTVTFVGQLVPKPGSPQKPLA
jgi:hypothetical protein